MLTKVNTCYKLTLKYSNMKLLTYGLFAVSEQENTLTLAIKSDQQKKQLHALRPLIGKKLLTQHIEPVLFDSVLTILKRKTRFHALCEKAQHGDDNAIINLSQYILENAIQLQASDIHIDPQHHETILYFRIDGLLQQLASIPRELGHRITNRFKIMASCDIQQKRLPQDGHFSITSTTTSHDFRLCSCPCVHGEKTVIRILNPNQALKPLEALGFLQDDLIKVKKSLKKPQGLILVTGPTGSGKTMTLYSLINELNNGKRNITTIENPVELNINGITQINSNDALGLGFSKLLRTLLRQDPDIIMIGEIRDKETADIAIRAANTGHLVLATLHTNSAIKTLQRLYNMGIEPYQLTSCINLIIAQRLVRKLCPFCKAQRKNCSKCTDGFKGRIGLFEVVLVTENLRQIMNKSKKPEKIKTYLNEHGVNSLEHAGKHYIQQGLTTHDEVSRVV